MRWPSGTQHAGAPHPRRGPTPPSPAQKQPIFFFFFLSLPLPFLSTFSCANPARGSGFSGYMGQTQRVCWGDLILHPPSGWGRFAFCRGRPGWIYLGCLEPKTEGIGVFWCCLSWLPRRPTAKKKKKKGIWVHKNKPFPPGTHTTHKDGRT